jgi:ABC-type branched-subunit amino acid transport system ATPase component
LPIQQGRIFLDEQRIRILNPRALLQQGVAYVPQGNRVFTALTVQENLLVAGDMLGRSARKSGHMDRILSLFPSLRGLLQRRAGSLSGGERQILALASALILSPRVLLLDEPSLGLAPAAATLALRHIDLITREHGVASIIIEQRVRDVLRIAHRVYAMRQGYISYAGSSASLDNPEALRAVYL